jgi:hypothetical protein
LPAASDPAVVYETTGLRTAAGDAVTLQLILSTGDDRCEIRIDRSEQRPHKTLHSVVLRITHPTAGVERPARAMTTIAHELERLHRQGYALRERAGGGFRGAWRADLMTPDSARSAVSWEIDLRKPHKRVEPLAHALATLDVPRPQFDEPDATDSVAALMRTHGAEVRRNHAVDALIAADPTTPADELIDELDARGLLTPSDPEE